ncbi:hypothetical protein H0H87_009770 [Tephrocybe sp. NHM501043]|nr:hypothetical protein H0H87_009770 [Tephrocybe sp. NHM501043]
MPVSIEDFEEVCALLITLTSAIKGITNCLKTLLSAGIISQEPRASIPKFLPPISTIPNNGASPTAFLSLCTHFSNVKVAVITAIITHEFTATNLHKLDPTNHDKETTYTFNGSTNQFKVSNQAAKEYKSPFLVLHRDSSRGLLQLGTTYHRPTL